MKITKTKIASFLRTCVDDPKKNRALQSTIEVSDLNVEYLRLRALELIKIGGIKNIKDAIALLAIYVIKGD